MAFGKNTPWVDEEVAILPWAGRAPHHPSETDCHLSAIIITTEFQCSFKSSFSSIVRKATKTGFLPPSLSSFLIPLSWMTLIMLQELFMNRKRATTATLAVWNVPWQRHSPPLNVRCPHSNSMFAMLPTLPNLTSKYFFILLCFI